MELEKLVKKMLVEDPFYGFMLTTLERRFTDSIKTMCVAFNENLVAELRINPQFYESLTDAQQMALLKHELLHLAFHHVTMSDTFPDARTFNEAADMEVNCYIKNLPDPHIDHTQLGLPPKLGTMAYYRAIRDWKQKNAQNQNPDSECVDGTGGSGSPTEEPSSGENKPQQNGNGNGSSNQTPQNSEVSPGDTLDDHTPWKSKTLEEKEQKRIADTLIDDIVLRTARSVKSRGTVPSEMQEIVGKLEKPFKRVFDWRKAFRRFLGNSYSENKKVSRRKESKRFVGAAGKKHLKRIHILVGVDTSGSVNKKELQEFTSELTYVQKTGAYIHVLECDARIHKEYDYSPGCLESISGRGGTDFQPVIDYYRKHIGQYDTLIYFTDGYSDTDNLRIPQNNIMWVISSDGCRKEYPGRVIYIPNDNNND